jgi:hypothetical protein
LRTSKISRRGTAKESIGAAAAATLGTDCAASFNADTPASESGVPESASESDVCWFAHTGPVVASAIKTTIA